MGKIAGMGRWDAFRRMEAHLDGLIFLQLLLEQRVWRRVSGHELGQNVVAPFLLLQRLQHHMQQHLLSISILERNRACEWS